MERNLAFAPRLGTGFSSGACLWVSPRPPHFGQWWLANQHLSFSYISRLETLRAGSGPKNHKTEPPLASSSAISLPCIPACSGTQNSPIACRIELLFNAFWHFWNKRRSSDGMKSFQGCLTITADAHVFLWSILQKNFGNTGQDSIYIGLKYCCISA